MLTFNFPQTLRALTVQMVQRRTVLVMESGGSVNIDPGQKPISGFPNKYGDKYCYHLNGKGSLTRKSGSIDSKGPDNYGQYSSSYSVSGKTLFSDGSLVEPLSFGSSATLSYSQISYQYSADLSASYTGQLVNWSISNVRMYPHSSIEAHFPDDSGTFNAPPNTRTSKRIELICDKSKISSWVGSLTFHFNVEISPVFASGFYLDERKDVNKYLESIVYDDFNFGYSRLALMYAQDWVRSEKQAQLVTNATSKLKYIDINSLAYIDDCRHLRKTTRQLMKTVRSIRSPKSWANAWLSVRYGLPLFIQDSSKIIQAARKAHRTKGSRQRIKTSLSSVYQSPLVNGEINIESHCCIKLDLTSPPTNEFYQTTRSLDLYPSLSNLWDLIPYSFVVDWVIPVDNSLQRLDAAVDILNFPIGAGIVSHKAVLPLVSDQWFGTASLSLYIRENFSQAALSRLPLSWKDITFDPDINLKRGIDTLSLMVQRWAKQR